MEIQFKTKENPEVKKVNFEMPADLGALTTKFGEDSVYQAAKGAFVISLQALLRRHYEKSQEELQAIADAWNPNERAPAIKQTPLERAQSALGKLSPEEKAEILRALRAK